MMRDGISVADIVVSLAGHDSGRLFAVIAADDTYVYLADGKERKLAAPKRKKRKHVRIACRRDTALEEMLAAGEATDSILRRILAKARDARTTEEGR